MVNFAPSRVDLDMLLNFIAIRLEITATQYKRAETSYRAVGEWLAGSGSPLAPFNPQLYPQGSAMLGTTVKPRVGKQYSEQYDLDIVSEIALSHLRVTFDQLYEAHYARLYQHEFYRKILVRKNRCLRLDYEGEFHLDILPAVPDSARGGTALWVPDRATKSWKESNPKGYARWFDGRKVVTFSEAYAAKSSAEPLPPQVDPENKAPLQRGVQLIKRQRDEAFGDSDLITPSIVYTTLAADAYGGQQSTSETISRYIAYTSYLVEANQPGPFDVLNPSNDGENLSERWRSAPGMYAAFKRELAVFREKWKLLLAADDNMKIRQLLEDLFGEDLATHAFNRYGEQFQSLRQQGNLGTRPGSSSILYGAGTSAGAATGVQRLTRNSNFGASR